MRKYFLYSLNDPDLNTPKYIGVSNNPTRRFDEHLNDQSITKKTKWIQKLKEGGKIPNLEVLKETNSIEEVLTWEIDYIKKYKEIYNLVNTTSGGEYYGIGTPILVFDLEGNYLSSYSSMIEYAELNNLPPTSVSSISQVCLRNRNYAYNHIFRYINDTVTQEDLNKLKKSYHARDPKHFVIMSIDGKILGEFNSLQEAEKQGFGKQNILSEVLREVVDQNTVKGNLICYSASEYEYRLNKYKKGLSKGKLSNGLSKYDLDGNYIETFYTYKDAVLSVSSSKNGGLIKQCCELKYKQAYGYQWRYGDSKVNIGKYQK